MAEKEVIAGWIIPGHHSVKDEGLLLGSRHCKRLGTKIWFQVSQKW